MLCGDVAYTLFLGIPVEYNHNLTHLVTWEAWNVTVCEYDVVSKTLLHCFHWNSQTVKHNTDLLIPKWVICRKGCKLASNRWVYHVAIPHEMLLYSLLVLIQPQKVRANHSHWRNHTPHCNSLTLYRAFMQLLGIIHWSVIIVMFIRKASKIRSLHSFIMKIRKLHCLALKPKALSFLDKSEMIHLLFVINFISFYFLQLHNSSSKIWLFVQME